MPLEIGKLIFQNKLNEYQQGTQNIMEVIKFPDTEDSYVEVWKQIPDQIKWSKDDFQNVWDARPEEHGKVKIFGKEIDVPRWQKAYLRDYKFSGMQHQAGSEKEVPEPVLRLFKWVQAHETSPKVNGILVNWYQNGLHYIGWHSDSESQLIDKAKIFSFSFGQEREFSLKSIKTGKIDKFPMSDNSLIVMCGTLQKTYKHAVLKVSGSKGIKLGPRINVTFRSLNDYQLLFIIIK